MKDNQLEMKDLDANDKLTALSLLLIHKGIITESELTESFEAVLQVKNEALQKELQANPGLALMFGMMSK